MPGLSVFRCFLYVISFVILFIVSHCASAQQTGHSILLRSGAVEARPNVRQWLDSVATAPHADPVLVMVHFTALPTDDQKQTLKQAGISLLDYVPDNTFLAHVTYPFNKEVIAALPVYGFVAARPEHKSSSYLWKQVNGKKGGVEVLVSFFGDVSPDKIKQFIASSGGQINHGPLEQYGAYKVIIDASQVAAIAGWYGTRSISPVKKMVPLDLESRPAVKGNIAVASHLHGGYDLHGDSVTVGVGDDASAIYHADVNERVTNFNPGPQRNHGEHVNGIVGGAGSLDPFAEGMAPHASLIDFMYDLILPATGAMYNDYHMTITNNSYEVVAGDCDYAGTYDVYSRFLDTLAVQFPEVLHVFASGNDGWENCSPFPQGFATVGGGYQPAKNNVVVGSMTDFYDDVNDESRGPVKDGRLKPEIEATGLIAYSTVGIDDYEWAAGTSMASPQVAGGLALLTQRYKQLNGGAQPRADLLKAILLNGAMDLGNPGPDYSHGFGEMNVYRSLQTIDSSHFFTGNMATGDSQMFTITVPAGTGQLKVMLNWTDVPASTLSSKQLVNDLDVTVAEPGGTVHLPLGLDPTPANVKNDATEKSDHINNTEQVTINNPVPGTYLLKVKGYSIPSGPQHYVVTYDPVPRALRLTYPLGGEQLLSGDSPFDTVRIFWDAVTDGNTFKVETSQDNGGSWFTINDAVPAKERHCGFLPVGLSTTRFLVRVSRNGTAESMTSGRVAFNAQSTVALDTAQCPGYLNIHWSPVLNATSYYLWQKKGLYMQVVDSTADTTYSFSGMSLNAASYVAVQPMIEGLPGYRSLALKAVANTGNCTKAVSAGDLILEKIIAPRSGRMFTSSQLTATTTMQLSIRDAYAAQCDSYAVSWQINGGAWQVVHSTTPVPANGALVVNVPGLDLSALGLYTISVAVTNLRLPDPQHSNDTLSVTVRNILNDPISLASPYADGFEAMPRIEVRHDSIGLSADGHWDFTSATDSGRMRSFASDDITITGSRSVSLDAWQALSLGSRNAFTGTFNLGSFDTLSSEIRMDFDYLLHGRPKMAAGNVVTARSADSAGWLPIYSYNLSAFPGTLTHVQSISLTDAMRSAHRNFSTSTQVSFGQNDTSLIAAPDYGNGITYDNFRIYTVVNDAALSGIVTPLPNNCGLASPGPLTVRVHNGVNNKLYNIHLFFSLDGGPVNSGVLDSIAPKADVNFTFSQQINLSENTTHSLNVWLSESGDSYTGNDSILNYHFRNSQIINTYPYLENFEGGDGGYYSDGYKNSWQYGTPVSPRIHKAASGTKAWKTNLAGNYNNLELSYLYSPCFDISGLTKPMLSFSAAMDIENCGNTLCDAAWVEYSYDGANWAKLGDAGQGTNWYDSTFDIWNRQRFTRWHVASILLPQPGAGYTVHFRFVLSADPGTTYEGLAIDDIHVFDLAHPILQPTEPTGFALDLSGNQWMDYTADDGHEICAVQPNNQTINAAWAVVYPHDTAITNPGYTQYVFPRNYSVKSFAAPADSVGLRLFLLEQDLLQVLADTTCPSCTPVADAFSLGVTQFVNPHTDGPENGTLTDDTGGAFYFHPYTSIRWVPYDKGYYAEFNSKPLGEYWFNNGGPTGNFPAGIDYLNFVAYRNGSDVACQWHSLIDTAVGTYTVEWSLDGLIFATAVDVPAKHQPVADYSINDPVNFAHHAVLYYRLKWSMMGSGSLYYSPVRKVTGDDSAVNLITFSATLAGGNRVLASWTSYIDGTVDHYLLDRAIGSSSFSTIENAPAQHLYGASYSYIDQPIQKINDGAIVHYRITAVLNDGTTIVLPEQTVEWVNGNTITDIYPNPTHDGRFVIRWFADAGTSMHLKLHDALGREIFQTSVAATQWNNLTTIQAPVLPHGVYYLRIDIGGNRTNSKLVVE